MGLRSTLRKIIPREIRDNPVLTIVAVSVIGPAALGALGSSAVAIAGATVAANTAVAVAVGTGVVTTGIAYVQGASVSDSLKAGVLSGVGSYAGSVVSNSVTNAVSNATGAPLGSGVGATVGPGGEFISTAGGTGFGAAGSTGLQTAAGAGSMLGVANPTFAGFLAGNVAGRATEAAITGRPVEQAALFGAAQSIGFGLDKLPDFKSLPKPVQDVLISSAQASVMGQDVGDAAIEALVKSTNIVGKALKEIPGGIEFTQTNPIATRYILNTVSSALAAQLQGKEISDTVLESLVRTTASVLREEFANSQANKDIEDANNTYKQAEAQQSKVASLESQMQSVYQKHEEVVTAYNNSLEALQFYSSEAQKRQLTAEGDLRDYNDAIAKGDQQLASVYLSRLNRANQQTNEYSELAKNREQIFLNAQNELNNSGFLEEFNPIKEEYDRARSSLERLLSSLDNASAVIAQNSVDLFTDFETELATTLAPLTAFEETDVTDQDLMAEISPVAPPTELAQGPVVDQDLLNQIQEVAARPDVGVPTDATQLAQAIGTLPEVVVTPNRGYSVYYRSPDNSTLIIEENDKFYLIQNQQETEISVNEAQRLLDEFSKNAPVGGSGFPSEGSLADEFSLEELLGGEADLGADQTGNGAGTQITAVSPPSGLTGATGAGAVAETGAGVGAGTDMAGFEAGAVGGGALPTQTEPSFTTLFNYLTRGGGSPYAENKAVFDVEGGFGSSAGSGETTFKLITIIRDTGEEVYDVGGKTYTLMAIPEIRRQVLVPTEPSPTILYVEPDQFNRPKFVETSIAAVPPREANLIANKIQETEKVAGGAPTGAEGAAGGLTAERPSTTTPTEQLQPGVRPEEVAPGVSAEAPALSFPDLISGITEPVMPAPVPGTDTGLEEALQAPGGDLDAEGGAGGGGGGLGDEITDEDIIRIIQGEIGEAGGGEGEGLPYEEGAGPGEGEEGAGVGAGEEGEGEGAGGEGEGAGAGEGEGVGTGEGGTIDSDIVPTITTAARRPTFRFTPGEGAPYRVTGMDESGILGRKQPLFGGDEDLQRAEWNRRSLRLRRLLGL